MALACDIVSPPKDARCGHPEINLGAFPGKGGTLRRHVRFGLHHEKESIFSTKEPNVKRGFHLDVLNRLVDLPEPMVEVKTLATRIQKESGTTLGTATSVVNGSVDSPLGRGQGLDAYDSTGPI